MQLLENYKAVKYADPQSCQTSRTVKPKKTEIAALQEVWFFFHMVFWQLS